jgi:hypothetical protein
VVQQTKLVGREIDGKRRGLRLTKMVPAIDHVIIDTGTGCYKSEFHYSPIELIGCPKGKNCGVYGNDKANVWECVDQGAGNCFPVGDMRYNLTMNWINDSHPSWGMRVRYSGGAANHSMEFHYHCDPNTKPGEFDLYDLGDETFYLNGQRRLITIHAHSIEICLEADWGQVNGGSIFLFIVVGFLLFYFGVGTLVLYFLNGSVSIPNESFWLEIYDSIATALVTIFTLGKGVPSGPQYDRI